MHALPQPDMAMRALLYSSASRHDAGGVQAAFSSLAIALRQRGHQIVEAWREEGAAPVPGEWVCPLEFQTGRFGLPGPVTLIRGGRAMVGLAARLARFRPAIVNVHYVRGDSLYFLLLRRWFSFRLVLSVHGTDLLRQSGPARHLLRRADAVTVVSRHLLSRVLESGVDPDRVRLIANGVDLDFWTGATRADRAELPPRLVFAGRLAPVKGIDVLLDAFARMCAQVPGARLTIVGDGESRESLQRQAGALGLAGRVDFTGHLDRDMLRDVFARSGLFVLPSHSEGMPLALLEAMAAGLPAVATRVGGVPEVLTEECGRLVPPGDPAALAESLVALSRHPDLAILGSAAQRRAAAFSSRRADDAYERLFLELRAGALRSLRR